MKIPHHLWSQTGTVCVDLLGYSARKSA